MFGSIRLGKVLGIPIGVNWSVLLIAWLIAWGLAAQVLPGQVPGLTPTAYWAAGLIVAGLFFASLLAHELAHAVVARREGQVVEGITLWLLGGFARMRGDTRTPGAEARIAIVGPLTSLVLGGAFAVVSMAMPPAATGDPLGLAIAAAEWLAVVNVVLAAFNMLPGVPLDGGRVVRAVLWRWRGDRMEATRLAAGVGQALGYGLVGLGLAELVVGADLGGLWSIVLGIFLSSAAGTERRQTELAELLAGLRVGEVMTRDPVRVPGSLTVDTFLAAVAGQSRQKTWVAMGPGGAATGLLDLGQVASVPGSARTTTRLDDIAMPLSQVTVTMQGELVLDLLARLDGATPRAIVHENGETIGLLTAEDVERAIELARLRASERRRPGPGLANRPSSEGRSAT